MWSILMALSKCKHFCSAPGPKHLYRYAYYNVGIVCDSQQAIATISSHRQSGQEVLVKL